MINISGVHKSFGQKKVLAGVDLEIKKGESMVIIGGSGTGKSVLLKHIIGLLAPDSGSVRIEGVDINSLDKDALYKVRKRFGMLFQGAALFDSMSVWENVAFVSLREKSCSRKAARDIAEEKLRMVGLDRVAELMPSQLSGGMKKRVGLARAIAHEPEVLLYDEPTTGLDPVMAEAINDLILELKSRLSVTSVTITHDMHSAMKISDRIAMLYDGRIAGVYTPDSIKRADEPHVREFVAAGTYNI
ncbi:MAG: ABC transporter ATP-binding protein [Nitrospiraceae bacterium]|nr:ABC transporter ATP-binding protein [Nitrospiraceae bacterium]